VLPLTRSRNVLLAAVLTGGITAIGATGAVVSATPVFAAPRAIPAGATAQAGTAGQAPVFAYYYMWMNSAYWGVHKRDYPVRPFPGNYNSANPAVLRWQVREAQAAGIAGFIVSWKNNATYRRILPVLERVAQRRNFRLAMEYESLTKAGGRLAPARVAKDLTYFAAHYANSAVWYRVGGKPLTMWSGTDYYSPALVSRVTSGVRKKILVLNSASTVAEFKRLAPYTDGDAYYWSAVNPQSYPTWALRLDALAAAVHQRGEVWIAPFAPGFNARLIGGRIVVPRRNGLTLRLEYAAAAASAPDILGLISWNEWTENTYVEPSVKYGYTYPGVLKNLR
jgi:hypothetical protein